MSTAAEPDRPCGECKAVKPAAEFAWRLKAQGVRQHWCRACQATYQARYRINNPRRRTGRPIGRPRSYAS